MDKVVENMGLDPNVPADREEHQDSVTPERAVHTLRLNALTAHQVSVGRGDELVETLKRSVRQLESTHRWIEVKVTILFLTGLLLLGAGVYQTIALEPGVWAILACSVGGVLVLAATFWTTPLKQTSESVTSLVKLETAFLGYIRVIGELDSAFQMQYLDVMAGKSENQLSRVMNDTTALVKTMMSHTLEEIDKHVGQRANNGKELQESLDSIANRLRQIEEGGFSRVSPGPADRTDEQNGGKES